MRAPCTGQPFVIVDIKLVLQICETWHRRRGIVQFRWHSGDVSSERDARVGVMGLSFGVSVFDNSEMTFRRHVLTRWRYDDGKLNVSLLIELSADFQRPHRYVAITCRAAN